MIKTYKGMLADGGEDKIRLKTSKGEVGYRITKLQGITNDPGIANREHVLKIYKVSQATVTGTIDFTDNTLLGTAFVTNRSDTLLTGMNIIFDTEIFNQDIYITHFEAASGPGSGGPCNYYIELERIKLNENESTMATLQSMRTIAER